MKQSFLYSSFFFLLINTHSRLFSMERALEGPRVLTAADQEPEAIKLTQEGLDEEVIRETFALALSQDQQYWNGIFSQAINPDEYHKLRILAALLLPKVYAIQDIFTVRLFIEKFAKFFELVEERDDIIYRVFSALQAKMQKFKDQRINELRSSIVGTQPPIPTDEDEEREGKKQAEAGRVARESERIQEQPGMPPLFEQRLNQRRLFQAEGFRICRSIERELHGKAADSGEAAREALEGSKEESSDDSSSDDEYITVARLESKKDKLRNLEGHIYNLEDRMRELTETMSTEEKKREENSEREKELARLERGIMATARWLGKLKAMVAIITAEIESLEKGLHAQDVAKWQNC